MTEQNKETANTSSTAFLLSRELTWEDTDPGVKRQVMGYDGQLMLVKVKFEQGAVGVPHSHFHSQSSIIVSGKFEVAINGEKQILEAGDGFYVAPDAVHGVVCLEAGTIVDTFSPMRASFIGSTSA